METNTCYGCFGALVASRGAMTNPVCRCQTCQRWYHPACWSKYGCTKPECPGRTRPPRSELPPVPVEPGPVVVNYPYQHGPLNLLTDDPLGVSIGVVTDGRIDVMQVRNNSPDPLTVLTPTLPPWLSVRVVRHPKDERPADGRVVIPPGGTRELSVALHAVRPVCRRRIELKTVVRHPNGTDSLAGPVVPVEVVSAPRDPTVLAGLLVYAVGALLVAILLARSLAYPEVGVWMLTFVAALWTAGAAVMMPGVTAHVLAQPLALLGTLVPATAGFCGAVNAWLLDAEDRADWAARRLLLGGSVFLLAFVPGYLYWGIVTAILGAFTGSGAGIFVVVLIVLAVTAAVIGLPIRGYGGIAGLHNALFARVPVIDPVIDLKPAAPQPTVAPPPRP